MLKKSEKLCSIKKKERKENFKDIAEVVKSPEYICKKCLRASSDKAHLCKPVKLK